MALPATLDKTALKNSIEASLKRFSKGMLKTVALYTPPSNPALAQYGMPQGNTFQMLTRFAEQEHRVLPVDLNNGQVPPDADILVVVSPERLQQKQLFAIDQFLMQGGTVVVATSPFDVNLQGRLAAEDKESGLKDWLAGYGISQPHSMVLDPQNAAFPVPVERQVGGIFRPRNPSDQLSVLCRHQGNDGMNRQNGLISGIDQLSMTWASPIVINADKNKGRKVISLLQSSKDTWLSDSIDIQPNFGRYGEAGFAQGKAEGRQLLGVMVEGEFDSWFKGKTSPLIEECPQTGGKREKRLGGLQPRTAKNKPLLPRLIPMSLAGSWSTRRIQPALSCSLPTASSPIPAWSWPPEPVAPVISTHCSW